MCICEGCRLQYACTHLAPSAPHPPALPPLHPFPQTATTPGPSQRPGRRGLSRPRCSRAPKAAAARGSSSMRRTARGHAWPGSTTSKVGSQQLHTIGSSHTSRSSSPALLPLAPSQLPAPTNPCCLRLPLPRPSRLRAPPGRVPQNRPAHLPALRPVRPICAARARRRPSVPPPGPAAGEGCCCRVVIIFVL